MQMVSALRVAKVVAVLICLACVVTPFQAVHSSQVKEIQIGRSWPRSLAVDGVRGLAYTDAVSGIYPPTGFSFAVVNLSSNEVVRELPFQGVPGPMAIDGATGRVYAAGSTSIFVYDPAVGNFTARIEVGKTVSGIAFDSATRMLYAAAGSGVLMLDPASGRVVRSAAAGGSPQGIAVDARSGRVYVANYLSASVSVFSDKELAPIATVHLPAGSYPSQLAVDDATGRLYVTTDRNKVEVVDGDTGELMGRFEVGVGRANGTYLIALDTVRNRLFVATEPGYLISEFDSRSGRLLGWFRLASTAYEIVVDGVTGELLASNYHQITVISPGYAGMDYAPEAAVTTISIASAVLLSYVFRMRSNTTGETRDGPPSQPRSGHS
jgi:DNA-binding beta-propeller fold protein YncE